MSKTILLLSCVLTTVSCNRIPKIAPKNWFQEPDGFKDLKFGMAQADIEKALKTNCIPASTEQCICRASTKVGEYESTLYAFCVNNRLVSLLGDFKSDEYGNVRALFIERYGLPHEQKTQTVSNRFGATFDNESLNWKGEKVSINLQRYGDKLDKGQYVLTLISAMESFDKERKAKVKKDADTL